eukprot:gnl/TRDRNA2_/TRDRNA2_82392_c0_seq1.p1 gnl/TRDRNA2_/TRDRNA2_82392_c0~~gnl/TRDRNA2_/TRDRNA2_82392_c0_seq1.p1  ORF type:complete len:452 (-),score=55.18 gnl/TRDRNA2_/TRDRNA2_82392_c0_seq1:54-1409(-)
MRFSRLNGILMFTLQVWHASGSQSRFDNMYNKDLQRERTPSDSRPPRHQWPGESAEASNSVWPNGVQPERLEAWQKNGDGTLKRCWDTRVLLDTEDSSWPGRCKGLKWRSDADIEMCRESCEEDVSCAVWEFDSEDKCWQGQADSCDGSNSFGGNNIIRAQRIQHGGVTKLANLAGYEVRGLRNIGSYSGGNITAAITHCRKWCYSELLCSYWQYAEQGCWVDDTNNVPYPLVMGDGAKNNTDAAREAFEGEFVQHYCPSMADEDYKDGLRPGGYAVSQRLRNGDVNHDQLNYADERRRDEAERPLWWPWLLLAAGIVMVIGIALCFAGQCLNANRPVKTRGLANGAMMSSRSMGSFGSQNGHAAPAATYAAPHPQQQVQLIQRQAQPVMTQAATVPMYQAPAGQPLMTSYAAPQQTTFLSSQQSFAPMGGYGGSGAYPPGYMSSAQSFAY